MDTKPVPTLSPDGWVRSSQLKCDYLLSYFLLSQYSQTYIYRNQIKSFVWILAQYKNDLNKISAETEKALNDLFSSYFDSAQSVVETRKLDNGKAEVYISVRVTDHENKTLDVAKTVSTMDSKVVRIANLNNYGVMNP